MENYGIFARHKDGESIVMLLQTW